MIKGPWEYRYAYSDRRFRAASDIRRNMDCRCRGPRGKYGFYGLGQQPVRRWFGVGYLLYLAYRMWNADAEARLDGSFEVASLPKIYIQGVLICPTNPKVLIFIAFIFPQTVDAGKPLVPQLLVLGTCGALFSFIAMRCICFLDTR